MQTWILLSSVPLEKEREVGNRVGNTDFGGEGGDGKGWELGWEGEVRESEKEIVGDGSEGAPAGDRKSPPFVPTGVGGGVVKLADEGEPGEASRSEWYLLELKPSGMRLRTETA